MNIGVKTPVNMEGNKMRHSNVLIIGSGIAALQLSRKLRSNLNVIILTKSKLKSSNSYLAQGGVAAALGINDDPYKHYQDTLEAGVYHNDSKLVLEMTKEAPSLIRELTDEGCPFDKDENGNYLLGREGAHGVNRIVHGGGDATGSTIINFLSTQIQSNITVVEDVTVFDLMIENNRCIGAKGKFINGNTEIYLAEHIIIATGGCGQLYSYTSNTDTVSGDGIALAYLAGAEIADMEFIQFHPTLLKVNGKGVGLVSEAVRGKGGRLVTEDRRSIMDSVHPLADLGPRHIVSQTIYDYMKQGKEIYLDISSIQDFEKSFPTVTQLCLQHGIDLSIGLIPIVPGSHFLMGGIKTDHNGQTNIPGLYAIGEVACTGIHGANRLASNSLLEGLFFGNRLATYINNQLNSGSEKIPSPQKMKRQPKSLPLPDVEKLRSRMMDFTGIVRNEKQLTSQKEWLESYQISSWLQADFEKMNRSDISRAFMLITSWLITDSALNRTESRGGHYREDFPEEDDKKWKQKQIIQKIKINEVEENEQIKIALAT